MYRIKTLLSLLMVAMAAASFGQGSGNKKTAKAVPAEEIQNLGDAINSTYDELGPIISPDGKTLFFVVDNHPQNTFGAESSQDIWYSTRVPTTGGPKPGGFPRHSFWSVSTPLKVSRLTAIR